MSAITHAVVRRGVDITVQHFSKADNNDGDEKEPEQLPGYAAFILVSTITVFVIAAFLIQYSYGMVVATLAIVEDPQAGHYLAVNTVDTDPTANDDDINKTTPRNAVDDNTSFAIPKPITSKIRTAIRHLQSRGGRLAPFRGFGLFLLWSITRGIIGGIFAAILTPLGLNNYAFHLFPRALAEIALATVELAWVHVVISEPSTKSMWKRIPGFSSWKKFAPVVTLRAVASQLTQILPLVLGQLMHVFDIRDGKIYPVPAEGENGARNVALGMLAIFGLSLVLTVLVDIPATVTMIRVGASMLPEEDESIVPFDRTFGGRTTNALVGGSGKIGMLDAWKTFTWPARVRLVKLLAKVLAVALAIGALAGAVVSLEVALLGGGKLGKLFPNAPEKGGVNVW
ncbi:hypothetical protein AJ80_02332 [Polytolypa hystricis UAMH7299]|uniref:Uncharacterized protein n=1 Tax=Polytolypa hystricis (strain UAMH7299) TaxID=1447883 RepID=A0A2B7YRR2_POLH7|nr:hypothetical protein AJ80_02332 [Polytolypa hystricis UAMH7299]